MKKLLPHACMDLAFVFLTLCVLDQINPAMHFLTRNLFKIPLMIFLVLVIIEALLTILRQRADWRRAERKRKKTETINERTEEE